MTGKSPLTASEAQRAGLMVLAGSARSGGEADPRPYRAADAGWLDARADHRGVWRARRHGSAWRSDFMSGGVEAVKATMAPGAGAGEEARRLCVWRCHCVENLSPTGATGRSPGCAPRDRNPMRAMRISRSQLSKALRKKSSAGGGRGTR